MKTGFTFLICLISSFVLAQGPSIDWDANPVLHKVNAIFAKESAVILDDVRMHEYTLDSKGAIAVNISNRKLIKVNDDKGVEMYNKIYIPLSASSEVTDIKARVIQADGKIVNLPTDKIFEVEEEGNRYKKFALEGVEKGSEVEYVWHFKREVYFFGLERMQSTVTPCQRATFTLKVPGYLQFSVKGYNGITASTDTVINDQRIVTATGQNLAALNDEKYAAPEPYLANVQYKLSYNLSRDKNVRMYTWNQMAKNVYSNYSAFTDKELKAVDGFVKQINIPAAASEEDKIVAIEDYIKSSVNIKEHAAGEDASKIEKIIKTRVASNEGAIKLFIGVMDKLGIKYQIVFPSKKDAVQFDEELENYDLADDIVFYFPSTGNYLAPSSVEMRYPFIDPSWADTKGLFLKGTTIGTFKTAIAVFDSIAIQPYEKNSTNLDVKIKFAPAMDSMLLHSTQKYLGYSASGMRPAFNFLDKDKIDEFTRSVIFSSKNDNVQNIKVQNTGMLDGYKNKPLTIDADITTAELFEKAGKKLLVKIGVVIGPQIEMYQEKPRQLPVLMEYPHAEDRQVSFTIPDGYLVKNLNELNINVTDTYNGIETIGFISTYTLTGNELKINVHEFYKITDYPLSRFQQFIKVINSSADFNKITLILEKQ